MKAFSQPIQQHDYIAFVPNPLIRNPKFILFCILLVAAMLRIYISFFSHLPNIHRDSGDYLKQADAILAGNYINYFPNGYPLIIAFTKYFSGVYTVSALLWLNIFFAVATTYFVYQISNHLFKNAGLALCTALIFAIFPSQINITRWLITEVPTAFFLTGAYLFYLNRKYLSSGLFFAMCTFIRTEILLIFILLIVFELITLRRLNFGLMLAFLIPLLLVCSYSKHKTGEFSLAGHSKVNIMYSITAAGSDIDWDYIDKHPEIKTKNDAVEKYFDHMKSEPLIYLKQRTANLWELWGMPSSSDGSRSIYSRLAMLLENIFLFLFGIWGWLLNVRKFDIFILIFPFVVVTFIHTMMLALTRYTIPVQPFMLIMASWFMFFIFGKLQSRLKNSSIQ